MAKLLKLGWKYPCAALAVQGLCVAEFVLLGVGWCCGTPAVM